MDIRTYLKNNILLFDGAMGTYLTTPATGEFVELASLSDPGEVERGHREYITAGARAIKTNTFAANSGTLDDFTLREVVKTGWEIAARAAGETAFVFADIGPVDPAGDPAAEYRYLAERFLDLGAAHFLFETLSDRTGLPEAAAFIKARNPDAFILVSFAAQPDGFTRSGLPVKDLIRDCAADPNIDGVGLNCVTSAGHMAPLVDRLDPLGKPLAVMPNAGYPTVLGRKTYYQGDPGYFGTQLRTLAAKGARLVGGCCGTTPAHIAAAAKALKEPLPKTIRVASTPEPKTPAQTGGPFWEALLAPGRKPVAVELDPPEAADVTKFMAGAKELRDGGASIITIADCPIARARMDSSILACKIRRELQMEALPHMTCRDRNLNATKALLLGLCAEDVHNVLVVTGDPIPSASRDEVKSVYNFNSRMLSRYITALNDTALPTPFHVFGALNLNALNFSVQLRLAQKKVENGICGFLTQPVLTDQALENLRQARRELPPEVKLLGGIIPIVSHRNAVFMNNEVSGITVSEEIIRRYEGLDREAGEELAVEISAKTARDMADCVDGFYLITPFGRTGLMTRILRQMRQDGLID